MEDVIVGIDPGKKGAIAILREDGSLLDLYDMPLTGKGKSGVVDARKLAGMLAGRCGTAVIEKVGYVPGDGGLGAFSFGESAGAARGVVEALGFDTILVRPQEWRRLHGLKGADKRVVGMLAIELYPTAQVTTGRKNKAGQIGIKDGRTDALLIARYGLSNNGSEEKGS
ncbi:hypothetical protein [Pseudomonas koreensis]|uniref:hypothetical protein n=1 Tax=Pseudomonas koreensis TaxID=198620 RepID=UPI0020778224|nr:hypothetical protein [Pseudomonas koreensis]MCM8742308.1 hypothetical protein [Pseudomonas koreensis]